MAKKKRGKGTQFKPGEIANPKGRPRGQNLVSRCLKAILSEEVVVSFKVGKKRVRKLMSNAEAIARAAVTSAKKGSGSARDFVSDRTEGKVKEVYDINDRRAKLEKIAEIDPVELMDAMALIQKKLGNFGQKRTTGKRDRKNTRLRNPDK